MCANLQQIRSERDIGMALVWPALKKSIDDHFQFMVYGTSNKLNAYTCSKGTSG